MAKTWEWIKKHGAMVIAIGAGLVVAFYLFFRPSGGGTPVASTVSFPASGGGGGGSTGGGPVSPPAPSTPTLPYSPDFSVLQAITDAALRALYEKEYNLETQINQATLQGNTALINALTSALGNVQDQIKNYQPPAPTPTPTPTPGNATAPTLDPNFEQNLVSQYFAAVKKLGKAFDLQAFWRQELGAYNIPNAVADYVMNRAQAWNAATGSAPVTTAQVQAWLNQAYAQGLGNPSGSTPSSANKVGA